MEEKKKTYLWEIVVGIIVVIAIVCIPGVLGWIIPQESFIPGFKDSNDWIGFFGSYAGAIVGGVITLIVMKTTIKSTDRNVKYTIGESKNIQSRNENICFCNDIASLVANYCYESRLSRYSNIQLHDTSDLSSKTLAKKVSFDRKINSHIIRYINNPQNISVVQNLIYETNNEMMKDFEELKKIADELFKKSLEQRSNEQSLYYELKIKLHNKKYSEKLIEKIKEVYSLRFVNENEDFEKVILELLEETQEFSKKYVEEL